MAPVLVLVLVPLVEELTGLDLPCTIMVVGANRHSH